MVRLQVAPNAFITRLNYVSDYAIEATEGVCARSSESDAIVACIKDVLDCLKRNLEIAYAKGEELAAQTGSLADAREARDAQDVNTFVNGVSSVQDSQVISSRVELKIHRPDLLSDGKGLESARAAQHEERYNTLKSSLTNQMREVSNFMLNSNIASLCVRAVTAITAWERYLDSRVSVSRRNRITFRI